MSHHHLLTPIAEGAENGRTAPYLAASMTAEFLHFATQQTEYADQTHLDGTAGA